jgi:hypothetical protein
MAACVESVAPAVVVPPVCKPAAPIKVAEMPGVDVALARALRQRGVTHVEQLRRLPKPVLVAAFGDIAGRLLWATARGVDASKRTFKAEFWSGVGRLRKWLTEKPKTSHAGASVAVGSPDTAKA